MRTPKPKCYQRAFGLIWKAELGDGGSIPSEWLKEWDSKDAGLDQTLYPPHWAGRPVQSLSRGDECGVLRFATGTISRGRAVPRVTRYASKPTYLLLNHIVGSGDYGEHREGTPTYGFLSSLCYAAVELCESLAQDLSGAWGWPGPLSDPKGS